MLCPVPAEVAAACGDRRGLGRRSGGVGDLLRLGKRSQLAGGRRGGGVAVHRRRVLSPHLGVLRLVGRDRGGVLAHDVRRDQRRQLGTIGRDHRRGHGGGKRGLVGCRGGCGLRRGLLGLRGGGAHPRHIRHGRRRHRRRCRAMPFLTGQRGQHLAVRHCGGTQFGSQPIPGRRGGQHRARARPRIHPSRVDLGRKHGEIQCSSHRSPPCLAATVLTASKPVALKADTSSGGGRMQPQYLRTRNDKRHRASPHRKGRTRVSWLLPWLHRPSPLAQSRKAETSGGEADSDHGNSAGVGSRQKWSSIWDTDYRRDSFRLTSSRPGHTGMPTQCTREEDSAESQGRHPSRQSFDTTRRIRPNRAGSHLGSTLNPGGAVLTLGVFRRSRSVAYIRADASPSEVHTQAMVALAVGARQASCGLRPRSVHAQRCNC